MGKEALIIGTTGQDGTYLVECLLKKGYEVCGMKRHSSLFNTNRIDHLCQDPHAENLNLILHYSDLTDSMNITRLIQEIQSDEIYNLVAISHTCISFQTPEYVGSTDELDTPRILEAIHLLRLTDKTRIYQAFTSELYGLVQQVPQNGKTPFYPRLPYAVIKLYTYWIVVNRHEAYKMHAPSGILFNHESPIRGETFVTRKITRTLSRVALGMQGKFYMDNLGSQHDWGHAKDYIKTMCLILQQDTPSDYVIATGITTAIRDLIRIAGQETGLTIDFKGKGVDEKGYIAAIDKAIFAEKVGEKYLPTIEAKVASKDEIVVIDPQCFRPTEIDLLVGDPTKSQTVLGWRPEYDLRAPIEDMMRSGIRLFKHNAYPREGGFKMANYFE